MNHLQGSRKMLSVDLCFRTCREGSAAVPETMQRDTCSPDYQLPQRTRVYVCVCERVSETASRGLSSRRSHRTELLFQVEIFRLIGTGNNEMMDGWKGYDGKLYTLDSYRKVKRQFSDADLT